MSAIMDRFLALEAATPPAERLGICWRISPDVADALRREMGWAGGPVTGEYHVLGYLAVVDVTLPADSIEVIADPIRYHTMDVPVVDGRATLPDGRVVESVAKFIRVPYLTAVDRQRLASIAPDDEDAAE